MDRFLKLLGISDNSDYRAPNDIVKVMKKKYGQDIFVIGVTSKELTAFNNGMSYHTIGTTRPVEVGRSVVDIDCKSHTNTAERSDLETDEPRYESDWYDNFQVTSSMEDSQKKSKSYQLNWEKSTTKAIGGNLGLKIGGSFFNMAAAPSAEGTAGVSASYSKTTTEGSTQKEDEEQSLTQTYQVIDTLKVPPKTKVAAMITTWAVTYESRSTIEVTVDMSHVLSVRYRTMLSRRLGGMFPSTGVLTAEDLFGEEEDFKCEDYIVTFKRRGKISYLGEEVEVVKQKIPV